MLTIARQGAVNAAATHMRKTDTAEVSRRICRVPKRDPLPRPSPVGIKPWSITKQRYADNTEFPYSNNGRWTVPRLPTVQRRSGILSWALLYRIAECFNSLPVIMICSLPVCGHPAYSVGRSITSCIGHVGAYPCIMVARTSLSGT